MENLVAITIKSTHFYLIDFGISLVLDSGMAFTGDLHPASMATEDNLAETQASWKKLAAMKVETVHPAHGNPFRME
jgi:glyoxylase-like metal-dependent hydrolase (beta-lactamase superfamily II)